MNPDVGWRLPDSPLRASALTSKLIGLAVVVALAGAARAALVLGDGYPLKAAVLFAAIMGLSIGFLRQHHPFARFGAANQITLVRALLVAVVAGFIGVQPLPRFALVAVSAAGAATVLDGLDGWVARQTRMASAFGARFDMEIDALLILALSVLAWRDGKAGSWVIASGLLRYLFVAAGALAPWLGGTLPSSRRRQTICVVQIAALTIVMLPAIQPPASTLLAAIALAALAGSFLVDIVWLWRNAA